MVASESPDKREARIESNKMASRRAREKESPEKKAARNEAKQLADRIKRKMRQPKKENCAENETAKQRGNGAKI